jgi:hypothetical protein
VVAEEEAEVGFTVADLEVVVSTAAAFVVGPWLPDMLAAELAAAAAESALADRTFQIALRTLPAQDLGSLHLVIHHPDSLCMMDDLLEP